MPRLRTSATDYSQLVNSAVGFSGQEQEFFVEVKMQLMKSLLHKRIGDLGGCHALDLGCGTGSSHSELLNEGLKLDGVDVDSESLEIAHQRYPEASHTLFDGQTIRDC